MESVVYFSDLHAKSYKDSILIKTARLFDRLYDTNPIFKSKELVGIKTHFGEMGLATFLRPIFAMTIVEKIKEKGGNSFLFDTCTLYTEGKRTNAVSHINTAIKNGFSYASVDAPIIIADGLTGNNCLEIEINGKQVKTAKIAADIQYMNAIICLTHFKGHLASGFGGTLKNISMGMATRAGKLEMHSATKPFIINKCTKCGLCLAVCPVEAIEIRQDKAYINPDKCIGCMRCDTKCQSDAIKFNWDMPEKPFMEKMAEYASAFLKIKGKSIMYFNFLLDITPDCDCFAFNNAPVSPDIGVLASFDPLAIDQASVDLVNKHAGKDIFKKIWPKIDYEHILKYSEELGIGNRKYNLEKV